MHPAGAARRVVRRRGRPRCLYRGADRAHRRLSIYRDLAVAHAPKPPKTVAIVTSKFPSVHFISAGARDVAKKRSLQEVAWLEWA